MAGRVRPSTSKTSVRSRGRRLLIPGFVSEDDSGIPRISRRVRHPDNAASRTDPARRRRKLPPTPANSRNTKAGKTCSWRESPPIPAQPASAKTGLSRRRLRVRSPVAPVSRSACKTASFVVWIDGIRGCRQPRCCRRQVSVDRLRRNNLQTGKFSALALRWYPGPAAENRSLPASSPGTKRSTFDKSLRRPLSELRGRLLRRAVAAGGRARFRRLRPRAVAVFVSPRSTRQVYASDLGRAARPRAEHPRASGVTARVSPRQ
jgi:hypothetical protein